jgi:ribosomal protein S18 acetylase RimI-like enzyme
MPTIAAEAPAASWQRGEFEVSADPGRLDLERVHRWISGESYWAAGIPRDTFFRAVRHSLAFGLYRGDAQLGFARVVTDRATFAYLCDVWIDAAARGRGLGLWLVQCVLAHPDLQGLRRTCLMTRDAHSLYARLGFKPMRYPARYLELHRPEVYQ